MCDAQYQLLKLYYGRSPGGGGGGGGGVGEDSHITRAGCSSEILKKKTVRGTKTLFCGRGLKLFPPLRGSNSYITHYLLSCYFGSITLKGTAKA